MFKDLMPDYDGGLRMSKDYADAMEHKMPVDKEWKIPLIKLMRECFKAGEKRGGSNENAVRQVYQLSRDLDEARAQITILRAVICDLKR